MEALERRENGFMEIVEAYSALEEGARVPGSLLHTESYGGFVLGSGADIAALVGVWASWCKYGCQWDIFGAACPSARGGARVSIQMVPDGVMQQWRKYPHPNRLACCCLRCHPDEYARVYKLQFDAAVLARDHLVELWEDQAWTDDRLHDELRRVQRLRDGCA